MLINTHQNYDGRLLQRFTRILRRLSELVVGGEVDRGDVGGDPQTPLAEKGSPSGSVNRSARR